MKQARNYSLFLCLLLMLLLAACSSGSGSGSDGLTSDSDVVATGGCGDKVKNGKEACDGDSVGCETLGNYHLAAAPCKTDCSGYDASNCKQRDPSDKCGNGQKDTMEYCEIGDKKPCNEIAASYQEGFFATCNDTCTGFDTLQCKRKGTDTCKQIYDCYVKCAGNESCITGCIGAGSDSGKEKFTGLYNCYKEKCASGADFQQCTTTACPDKYYDCFPSEKCGNGTIDTGETCEKGQTIDCGQLDADKYKAGKEALCNSTCTGFDSYNCIDKNAMTCIEVFECMNACAADQTCIDACKAKSFADALNKLNTMQECYKTQCNNVDNGCYNEKCKFQTDACKTHATCGDKIIDKYEICEKGDEKDCGAVDPNKYESGTASAICNVNCTEFSTIGCFGFCSCKEVYDCVEKECGGQKNATSECLMTCKKQGSKDGRGNYEAWRKFIESCCVQQQGQPDKCGFDAPDCIKKADQEIGCAAGDNPKCAY